MGDKEPRRCMYSDAQAVALAVVILCCLPVLVLIYAAVRLILERAP